MIKIKNSRLVRSILQHCYIRFEGSSVIWYILLGDIYPPCHLKRRLSHHNIKFNCGKVGVMSFSQRFRYSSLFQIDSPVQLRLQLQHGSNTDFRKQTRALNWKTKKKRKEKEKQQQKKNKQTKATRNSWRNKFVLDTAICFQPFKFGYFFSFQLMFGHATTHLGLEDGRSLLGLMVTIIYT